MKSNSRMIAMNRFRKAIGPNLYQKPTGSRKNVFSYYRNTDILTIRKSRKEGQLEIPRGNNDVQEDQGIDIKQT